MSVRHPGDGDGRMDADGRTDEDGRMDRAGLIEVAVLLLGAPVAWAVHLLVVYFLVTLDCESTWNGSTWAVTLATLAFAGASAWVGVTCLRRWRRARDHAERTLDADPPRPFVHLLGLAASLLFTLTILLTGLPPFFVGGC